MAETCFLLWLAGEKAYTIGNLFPDPETSGRLMLAISDENPPHTDITRILSAYHSRSARSVCGGPALVCP